MNYFKKKVKKIFEQLTRTKVYRVIPFGVDEFYDINRKFPGYQMDVMFDVGANIGQSAREFVAMFSEARIYCFEPSLGTFETLKNNLSNFSQISFHNLALGNERALKKLIHSDGSDKNRILAVPDKDVHGDFEEIRMDTLSDFCDEHGIKHINFLKIDTEGFDLEVLKSGASMLAESRIDFAMAEVGISHANTLHVSLESVRQYMQQHNYFVFGIYEQIQDWKMKMPVLRRVNVLFISPKLAHRL